MPPNYYPQLLLLIPLAALVAEDLRTRTVRVVWLVALGVISLIVAYNMHGIWQTAINIVLNLFLLFYLSIGVIIYILFKHRRWVNPLCEYIGSGDVIFLLALTPLFDLRGYLLFLICACTFSLLWTLGTRVIHGKYTTIPLAGTMGISLGALILVKIFIL